MKNKVQYYTDGADVRLHNKQISFKVTNEKTMIRFKIADIDADKPACAHKCHRGKVRDTFIQMSNEAMESLVFAYLNYKHQVAKSKQTGT